MVKTSQDSRDSSCQRTCRSLHPLVYLPAITGTTTTQVLHHPDNTPHPDDMGVDVAFDYGSTGPDNPVNMRAAAL